MSIPATIINLSQNIDLESGDVSHLINLRIEGIGVVQALVTADVAKRLTSAVFPSPAAPVQDATLAVQETPAPVMQTMPDDMDDDDEGWDPADAPRRGNSPPMRTVPVNGYDPAVTPAARQQAAEHGLFADEDGVRSA